MFLFSFCGNAANIYRDPSCKIALRQEQLQKNPELFEALKTYLANKDFQTFTIDQQDRITIGTLHLNFKKMMTGDRLYPQCEIMIDIKKGEHTHPSKNDKTIFELNAKRSFPRLTFEGTYRCKKAIRDALFSLPYCRGPANQ